MPPRYAIYFSPDESSYLYQAASRWLGHDLYRNSLAEQAHQLALPECLKSRQSVTKVPARYGLHATLKAPFHLAAGYSVEQLQQALAEWTMNTSAITCSAMELVVMDQFIALTIQDECPALQQLAKNCVIHFDHFRKALSPAEIARRNPAQLHHQQRLFLQQWGYPFVMEAFRFHLTLTGRIEKEEQKILIPCLQQWLKLETAAPLTIDRIVLCEQKTPDSYFTVRSSYPLLGAVQS